MGTLMARGGNVQDRIEPTGIFTGDSGGPAHNSLSVLHALADDLLAAFLPDPDKFH